jgi:hypothetical protein
MFQNLKTKFQQYLKKAKDTYEKKTQRGSATSSDEMSVMSTTSNTPMSYSGGGDYGYQTGGASWKWGTPLLIGLTTDDIDVGHYIIIVYASYLIGNAALKMWRSQSKSGEYTEASDSEDSAASSENTATAEQAGEPAKTGAGRRTRRSATKKKGAKKLKKRYL